MTAISIGIASAPTLEPGSNALGPLDAPNNRPSFANILDSALARNDSDDDGRLPGGTMRSSVEMFDEHGFFAGTGKGESCPQRARILDELLPSQPAPLPIRLPVTSVFQPDEIPAPDAGMPSVVRQPSPGVTVERLVQPGPPIIVIRVPPCVDRALLGSVPSVSSRAKPPEPSAGEEKVARSMPSARPAAAASPIKVALNRKDAGVAVSVVAPRGGAIDDAAVREAVARMLARYGLVLGELRVNRRASADAGRGG